MVAPWAILREAQPEEEVQVPLEEINKAGQETVGVEVMGRVTPFQVRLSPMPAEEGEVPTIPAQARAREAREGVAQAVPQEITELMVRHIPGAGVVVPEVERPEDLPAVMAE